MSPVQICEAIDRLIAEHEQTAARYRCARRSTDEARIRYDAKADTWAEAAEQLEALKREIL